MTKRMFEGSSKPQGGSSMQQQQHQQYLQQMHHQAAAAAAASGHGVNMNRHVSPAPSPSNQSQRSSSGGVPDYTQVSPAKMALRRHLSQEKLSTNPVAPKTIGDLVNGEIERTLEISHQSIINAAVNMSTNHPIPMEVYNVPRPERVNVRGPEEYNQAFGGGGGGSVSGGGGISGGYRGHEISGRYSGQSHDNSKMMATSTSTSTTKNSSNLFMASYTSNSLNSFGGYATNNGIDRSGVSRDGGAPTACLPRAEMKPYLEQYFLDDQFAKSGKMSSRSGGGGSAVGSSRGADQESHRMSGPLEGLAASLQARVRATLNIKEEPEVVGRGMHGAMKMPMSHPIIKQEGKWRNLSVSRLIPNCKSIRLSDSADHPMVMLPEGRHSDSMDSLISPSESYVGDEKKMMRHRQNDDGKSSS